MSHSWKVIQSLPGLMEQSRAEESWPSEVDVPQGEITQDSATVANRHVSPRRHGPTEARAVAVRITNKRLYEASRNKSHNSTLAVANRHPHEASRSRPHSPQRLHGPTEVRAIAVQVPFRKPVNAFPSDGATEAVAFVSSTMSTELLEQDVYAYHKPS